MKNHFSEANCVSNDKIWIHLLLAIALFSIFTFLRMGNSDVRIANAISDDHPVVYAHYFKNPQKWQSDVLQITGLAYVRSSIQNWSTAYLHRYLHLNPAFPSLLFVLIQNIGLAIALLLYCRYLNSEPIVYWLAATATFASQPWASNLAYYPNVMHSPYPGHLVVPFLILGTLSFLKEKWPSLTAYLAIAALIHPAHTIHLMMILTFIVLMDATYREKIWKLAGIFTAVTLLAVFPAFFLIYQGPHPLTSAEVIPTLLTNPHLVPWKNEIFWSWELPTLIGIFIVAYFAQKRLALYNPKLKALYWANLFAVIIAGSAQLGGVLFKFPPLILFCPLRVSVLNALLLMPLGYLLALDGFKSKQWALQLSALLAILFPIFSTTGFFWGQNIPLIIGLRAENKTKRIPRWLGLFCLSWVVLYLGCGKPFRSMGWEAGTPHIRYLLAPAGRFDIQGLALIGILALMLLVSRFKLELNFTRGLFLFFILGLLGLQTYREGQETQKGKLLARYEIQKWAKENTPDNSLFILRGQPWRGISERRVLYAENNLLGMPAYFRFREIWNQNKKLTDSYEEWGVKDFEDLTKSELIKFKNRFGGDYVLRAPEATPLGAPILFKNSIGVIYQMPSSAQVEAPEG